jgi:hypothetical protein
MIDEALKAFGCVVIEGCLAFGRFSASRPTDNCQEAIRRSPAAGQVRQTSRAYF